MESDALNAVIQHNPSVVHQPEEARRILNNTFSSCMNSNKTKSIGAQKSVATKTDSAKQNTVPVAYGASEKVIDKTPKPKENTENKESGNKLSPALTWDDITPAKLLNWKTQFDKKMQQNSLSKLKENELTGLATKSDSDMQMQQNSFSKIKDNDAQNYYSKENREKAKKALKKELFAKYMPPQSDSGIDVETDPDISSAKRMQKKAKYKNFKPFGMTTRGNRVQTKF